jgi:hypothetical protein
MTDPNWTEVLTATGTVATAVFTLALVGVAVFALWGWKKELENQRADECVSAIRDFWGAVGRCVSLKKSRPQPHWDQARAVWQAHGDMWDAWRRFDRAFSVACRYHKELDRTISEQIKRELYPLDALLHDNLTNVQSQIEEVQRNVGELLKSPQDLFVPPLPHA